MKTEDCITKQPNVTVSWPVLFGVVLLIITLVSGSVGATAYIMAQTSDTNERVSKIASRVDTLETWVDRNEGLLKDIKVVKEVLQRVDARLARMEERFYMRPNNRRN